MKYLYPNNDYSLISTGFLLIFNPEFVMMKCVVVIAFTCCLSIVYAKGSTPDKSVESLRIYSYPASSFLFSLRNGIGPFSTKKTSLFVSVYQPIFLSRLFALNTGMVLPLKNANLCFNFSYHGFKFFRKSLLACSYSRKVLKGLSSSLQLAAMRIFIPDLGSRVIYTAGIGLECKILSNLIWRAQIFNPFKWKVSKFSKEIFATILSSAFLYKFSKKLESLIEIKKSTGSPLILNYAVYYSPIKSMGFECGFKLNPTEIFAGYSILINWVNIEFNVNYQAFLGAKPTLQFISEW